MQSAEITKLIFRNWFFSNLLFSVGIGLIFQSFTLLWVCFSVLALLVLTPVISSELLEKFHNEADSKQNLQIKALIIVQGVLILNIILWFLLLQLIPISLELENYSIFAISIYIAMFAILNVISISKRLYEPKKNNPELIDDLNSEL